VGGLPEDDDRHLLGEDGEGFEPSSWQSASCRNMCLKGGLFRERG
jgi:hypothetical protein